MRVIDILKKIHMPKDIYEYYKRNNRIEEVVEVPDEKTVKRLSKLLKCLANPIRLKLLMLLKRPHCVYLLSTVLGLDTTLISHHLAKLKECGMVKMTPSARARIYELNKDVIRELISTLEKVLLEDQ